MSVVILLKLANFWAPTTSQALLYLTFKWYTFIFSFFFFFALQYMGSGESFNSKEIKPVNQHWLIQGKSNLNIHWKDWCWSWSSDIWPSNAKSRLIGKDPDAGQDWGQEEKGVIEDEVVVWHHRLNGHKFEQTPGDGEGQGSLACCSLWGRKELDTS